MADKQIITDVCEFQSDCIEYKDISYLKIMPICAIHELSIACHDKVNKCKYYKLYKQLKAKEQECEELKEEINGYKTIIEKIRQEVQEDVTCESRECGCDSYEECIECLKNTILNIIYEGNDFVQGKVICKECGKYKKALEEIESLCKNEACAPCKELEENETLKQEVSKFKQALDEIEKYLDAQQKYFDGEDYHNLLDIINKVKGETDEES